jgi:hypothetical protein
MRDMPALPTDARTLACRATGEPTVFQLWENCVGFLDHPAIKAGVIPLAGTLRFPAGIQLQYIHGQAF